MSQYVTIICSSCSLLKGPLADASSNCRPVSSTLPCCSASLVLTSCQHLALCLLLAARWLELCRGQTGLNRLCPQDNQHHACSHHLSADGAVDGSQPRSIPPVGYNTGAWEGEKQHVLKGDPHRMKECGCYHNLTTEQMPTVGFNGQDGLLQTHGTGHVCVELLPVLCLKKAQWQSHFSQTTFVLKKTHSWCLPYSWCHTLGLKKLFDSFYSFRFSFAAVIKRQTSADSATKTGMLHVPVSLRTCFGQSGFRRLTWSVWSCCRTTRTCSWFSGWMFCSSCLSVKNTCGLKQSLLAAWPGACEVCIPAEQREEATQERDTDHNNKQHLVADTFDEGVLILDQVVPTVAVLHYPQSQRRTTTTAPSGQLLLSWFHTE